MKNRVIGLLTDFGLSDHYVGTMKAVVSGIAPHVSLVDISHGVPPQSIDQAAYLLWAAYRFFPPGTIFVAVVDPGVGGSRAVVCASTSKYTFLAPDNGLLKYVLSENRTCEIRGVTNRRYFLPTLSSTFHGRDIFAPVAAHLAMGVPHSKLGKRLKAKTTPEDFVALDARSAPQLVGRVIHIDRFGNIITNIRVSSMLKAGGVRFEMRFEKKHRSSRTRHTTGSLVTTYEEGGRDAPVFLVGSSGLLEISVKNSNAAQILSVAAGTPFRLFVAHAKN
jgi:S-adenosylmethionine hydrolase